MRQIHKIVIEGGPCGGKTTAMTYLSQKLRDKGYLVLIVPESATLCIMGGIHPGSDLIGVELTEWAIVDQILKIESTFEEVARRAKGDQDVILLCDRGIPGCSAYVPQEVYEKILREHKLDPVEVRDHRYKAVFHLVTAAEGAEKFYTLDNNPARLEKTLEAAIEQDHKTRDSWNGHPHRRVVDNSTDFDGKLFRLYQEICHVLGIPVPIERERKFLVNFDRDWLPKNAQHIEIEQMYLGAAHGDKHIRIRKRGQNGSFIYIQTTKERINTTDRIEREEFITEAQYEFGTNFRQSGTAVVWKTRTCFEYKSQCFELDVFADPQALPEGQAILELEITDPNWVITFPEWVEVIREVTGELRYENYGIAKALALGVAV